MPLSHDALIFDIEGTITDIRFVADVLFPYARCHMPAFLHTHHGDDVVKPMLDHVRADMGQPEATLDAIIAQLDEWMAVDKKIGSLKALQGLVWRFGFEAGEYKGHFYDDVPEALNVFRQHGKRLYIYSSGSVEAQLLLLRYSCFGDMRHLIDGHFDTSIGSKLEAASYVAIAERIEHRLDACLFFSDHVKELEAAKQAGMDVIEVQRHPTQVTPFFSAQGWPVWSVISG